MELVAANVTPATPLSYIMVFFSYTTTQFYFTIDTRENKSYESTIYLNLLSFILTRAHDRREMGLVRLKQLK